MKKIGIIGGAGPLASALLYETLVKECYLLRKIVPEIVLISYPFTRGLTLQESENHRILKHELTQAIASLHQHGVGIALLACNTLHMYLEEIPSSLSFMPLPQAVLQEAASNGHRRLLILGTQNTCTQELYKYPGVTLIYPQSEEQALIDRIIDQVLGGNILPEDAFLISQLLEQKRGYDGVVLGCTELPVLHHHFPLRCVLPIYDSIKIPAKKLIKGLL